MWRVPQVFGKNLRGSSLTVLSALAAGWGFLLFGYDQGVMSGLITAESYLEVFPETADPNVSGITVAIYEIGCLFGAVFAVFYGDKLGRKNSILLGMLVMLAGTAIMTASMGLPEFIVGRIVTGLGNGVSTATIPALQSELAPARIRGALILLSGALISGGIMVSYWIGLGFYFVDNSSTWRAPIALQAPFAVITIFMLFCIPESPAWLTKKGYTEEAGSVLARMYNVEDDDPVIAASIHATQTSMMEVEAFRFRDLFTNGPSQNFRRFLLAVTSQAFQQLTGCNVVTYYAASLFENSIGLSPLLSRILAAANGTEYFIAALVACFFVDRLGRRTTMMWGALGCGLSMLVLCITVTFADRGVTAAGFVACVFLFVFNTCFAFGWLGSTWLYPAEITSLAIRSQANGFSTVSNWLFNFMVVMVTPPSFDQIGPYTYLVFAILNLCLILPSVWWFYPEGKGRTLEEIDLIFAEAYNDKLNYVSHSVNRPRIEGAELDAALIEATARGKLNANGDTAHLEHSVGMTQRPAARRLQTEASVLAPPRRNSQSSDDTAVSGDREKAAKKQ